MNPAVAIVGMACRYPDADTPQALWENVLAQRRAFRRMPAERLHPDDYWSPDPQIPDRTYATQAAVLEGYTFDRVRFRVSGDMFRAADLAHWLALDVADQALADAGFSDAEGIPRETTGVLLGNTLTGEFSRAGVMRLRWPYVRRTLDAALAEEGWDAGRRRTFLEGVEARYKAPFPPVGTETLAGGLSNTIAGRICNYFDLKGGGYTVDGACASSLLAVINACTAVAAGDLDVALAGGVDLSLDPFEMVGFAKVGALAQEMMRVYDTRSEGFWPGEGCGFVVLMREDEAIRQGRRIYAVLRGWGVSSDGSGGITRPEADGQMLAVRRAWQRAGYGIETAGLFEGHGTGTRVGDETELRMLVQARREAGATEAAALGSVKANIGHTKAAAGVAGLLKATLALHHQVLPPTTGCDTPHPVLEDAPLRVLQEGERWPQDRPLRAAVSAMGFGGINTHLVLDNSTAERYGAFFPLEHTLLSSAQDAELFVLSAPDMAALKNQVAQMLVRAPTLAMAEMADLAATLAASVPDRACRAAVVAASPDDLVQRLATLAIWLEEGIKQRLDTGIYLGTGETTPRIGFLFPGQGSPAHLDGGRWRRRFATTRTLYDKAGFSERGAGVATEVAQPAIVTASLAALRVLNRLGITATTSVGHSLGELTALHWAGALNEQAVVRLASVRGRAMADLGDPTGTMASVAAGADVVERLIANTTVVIAGLNGPQQTVVSGEADAVADVLARAEVQGLQVHALTVSHAFHSPLVAAAADPLATYLADHPLQAPACPVVSTVTGTLLKPEDDLADLLVRQVTSPVRFTEAMATATHGVDLWVEVGPGRVLGGLARRLVDTPVVSTDAGGASLMDLLQVVGAAFALGAPVQCKALFEDRFTRPFNLDHTPQFLSNPCEQAPLADPAARSLAQEAYSPHLHTNGKAPETPSLPGQYKAHPGSVSGIPNQKSKTDLIRQLVAERAELPLASVRDTDRLLSDLHLNSITVSELVNEASRRLGLPPSATPTNYADASLAEIAEALETRSQHEGATLVSDSLQAPAGLASWVRPFTVALVARPRPHSQPTSTEGSWQIFAPEDYPLEKELQSAFSEVEGKGVVVALPPEVEKEHLGLLLAGARRALAAQGTGRFVLVQHGSEAAAFARSLHMESRRTSVCVVDVPLVHPEAVAWVQAEAQASTSYTEAYYNADGVRREPRLRLLPLEGETEDVLPLGPDDVLLVTGGGKGITAECVFALAQETRTRLVLVGRSRPEHDEALNATLARMVDADLSVRYFAVDVTDAEAVRAMVEDVQASFGPITAVLHGAARNVPQGLASLDEEAVLAMLAPKVEGLRNLLDAIDPQQVRLLITFGSIIARIGLPGEAHYALANAWLTRMTERWQKAHPHCRCLAVEWSVWSGVGMGARLGSVDALMQRGITPIPPDTGVAMLRRLLSQPLPAVATVVAGRFGEPPTLRLDRPDLPLLRFLEQPRVYYPGVELIVEATLSVDTDPYLGDHVLQGERLLPAVVGLEAMAQVAQAVTGSAAVPRFEDADFLRPVVVPRAGALTIRLIAYVRALGTVDVVLRSEQTSFQTDHFRVRCCFEDDGRWTMDDRPYAIAGAHPEYRRAVADEVPIARAKRVNGSVSDRQSPVVHRHLSPKALDPGRDLYGSLLFHRGRFKRLQGYRLLRATACVAEIASDDTTPWFGSYLPARLALGDPGARDAVIHAIQACIPHATLLPIGLERLVIERAQHVGVRFAEARERAQEGDTFVYDVAVTDAKGQRLERWEGLRLQRVGPTAYGAPWSVPLLGVYLERRLQELIPEVSVSVMLLRGEGSDRRAWSDRAIQEALGAPLFIRRATNGKPDVEGTRTVSAAHAGDLTLAMAATGPVGCDLEPVVFRSEAVWRDLLGDERFTLAGFIVRETQEDFNAAATRVWTALESIKKAGFAPDNPLVLHAVPGNGWVMISAGEGLVGSYITQVDEQSAPLALSVLLSAACPPQTHPVP